MLTLRSGDFVRCAKELYPACIVEAFFVSETPLFCLQLATCPSITRTQDRTFPAPIEILPWEPVDIERRFRCLGSNKDELNSAASYSSLPITLGFARRVEP